MILAMGDLEFFYLIFSIIMGAAVLYIAWMLTLIAKRLDEKNAKAPEMRKKPSSKPIRKPANTLRNPGS